MRGKEKTLKYHPDADLESPRIFAGYAKNWMRWDIIHALRPLIGKERTAKRIGVVRTLSEIDLQKDGESDEDFDVFESLNLISAMSNPSIDEITRHEFEELFGVLNSRIDVQVLRKTLYETAYEVLERNQMRESQQGGSGNYRKSLDSAILNRRVAFYALYISPAIGEEVSLKEAASVANADYDSVVKEAQKIPLYLFAYKDEIIETLRNKLDSLDKQQ